MARDERLDEREAEREMREAMRSEPFIRGGVNQLVKVLPLSGTLATRVDGYMTMERFLLGRTPKAIEAALGLKVDSLVNGCCVFGLQRQPGPSEVVYELTTAFPDGAVYTVLSHPDYPPGERKYIHQWRVRVRIPARLLCVLRPDQPYASSR